MPAFILDLDGTLMPSHAVDNRCYWAAVADVFELPVGTLDLRQFRNATDGGILAEWAAAELGRQPTSVETAALRARFLELLEDAAGDSPEAFTPMPGLLDWLQAQPAAGVSLAIATGGWPHTARFKLRTAGLGDDWLLAAADDGIERTTIMRAAQRFLGHPGDHETTYFGDGPWDVTAAKALNWGFIGIAEGERAARLVAAGATEVYADFTALV